MPSLLARSAAIACFLLLAACSGLKPPADVDAAARLSFEQLREGDDIALLARATPEIRAADPAALARMRATLPPGEPSSSKAVAWNVVAGTGGHSASVEHVYEYGDAAVVASTALIRPSGDQPWQIQGLHVSAVTAEQMRAGDLTFSGKGPIHYGFLAAVPGALALMIFALVAAIRAPGLKRKWLWGLLAFVGLFSFHLNWATGEVMAQWLTVRFIGLGMVKNASPLAPWIVTFTLPVGAVLVLLRVAKARREARTAPADS